MYVFDGTLKFNWNFGLLDVSLLYVHYIAVITSCHRHREIRSSYAEILRVLLQPCPRSRQGVAVGFSYPSIQPC